MVDTDTKLPDDITFKKLCYINDIFQQLFAEHALYVKYQNIYDKAFITTQSICIMSSNKMVVLGVCQRMRKKD